MPPGILPGQMAVIRLQLDLRHLAAAVAVAVTLAPEDLTVDPAAEIVAVLPQQELLAQDYNLLVLAEDLATTEAILLITITTPEVAVAALVLPGNQSVLVKLAVTVATVLVLIYQAHRNFTAVAAEPLGETGPV